jgi:hypothetical protein
MHISPLLSSESHSEQVREANHEFAAFLGAVTKLYGPEQARLAAEDWLEEAEKMDSPPWSAGRDWRAVTIAASARLANRLNDAQRRAQKRSAADTKVSRNTFV